MPPSQHSPTETAARLTFRRAPSFSSPVAVAPVAATSTSRGSSGGAIDRYGTTAGFSTLSSPMATLRGFFTGTGSMGPAAAAAAAAAATASSSSSRRRTRRVGFEDERYDEEEGGGRGGEEDDGPIALKMTLGRFNDGGRGARGRTRMVFTDEGWQVDDDLRRAYERRLHELSEELAQAEHAALASQSERQRLEAEREAAGVLKFKNRLLVEMLAIAQLDEAAAREALGRERAKSDEYRQELRRCYARMLGFGIDPAASAGAAAAGAGAAATVDSSGRAGGRRAKSPVKQQRGKA